MTNFNKETICPYCGHKIITDATTPECINAEEIRRAAVDRFTTAFHDYEDSYAADTNEKAVEYAHDLYKREGFRGLREALNVEQKCVAGILADEFKHADSNNVANCAYSPNSMYYLPKAFGEAERVARACGYMYAYIVAFGAKTEKYKTLAQFMDNLHGGD